MAAHSVKTADFEKKIASQLTQEQTTEIHKLTCWIEGITEVAGIAASSTDQDPSDHAVNNALWAARELSRRVVEIVESGRQGVGGK